MSTRYIVEQHRYFKTQLAAARSQLAFAEGSTFMKLQVIDDAHGIATDDVEISGDRIVTYREMLREQIRWIEGRCRDIGCDIAQRGIETEAA